MTIGPPSDQAGISVINTTTILLFFLPNSPSKGLEIFAQFQGYSTSKKLLLNSIVKVTQNPLEETVPVLPTSMHHVRNHLLSTINNMISISATK